MGHEATPGRPLKDLFKQAPSVDNSLQKVLRMIRRPGGPAWPKRLRLRTLSEEELPKAAAEVGKATVGLTEKTLPGLMRYRKIEKANLNGNNNDKPLVFPNGQTAPQLEGKQRQFLERVIIAATEGRIFSEEDLRKIYTDSRTSSYLWNLLSATRHWVELKIKPLGWTTEWHKPGENGDQRGYELKKIEDSSIVSPTIKPPSNEQATSAKSSYSLTLPSRQIIPGLLKQEAEILGLVIKAPNQSLDLSDPHLEKSHPELFSKNSAGSFRVQLSRLRSKLSKLGWNIETVGFKTGWRNNHRGKIELRRIEKLDDNPEDQVTASAPTEHVEQEDKPTHDSPPPTQEPATAPTVPTELPRGGTIVDFSDNGNETSPKREVPEKLYHVVHKSREAEKITKSIAYQILSSLAEGALNKIPSSHIKILQAKLAGKGIRDVFGITTKVELDEYFISFLMDNLENLWDTKGGRSLSIEELRIQGGLATLREANYTTEKIEEVLRFHFSIPAPAPTAESAS